MTPNEAENELELPMSRRLPVLSPAVVALVPAPGAANDPAGPALSGGSHFTHKHVATIFTVVLLIAGAASSQAVLHLWSARSQPLAEASQPRSISGLNEVVPSDQLDSRLKTITSQPATLTLGSQTITIPAGTIKSWLKITHNDYTAEDIIHVSTATITSSLTDLANKNVKAPVNEVTTEHDGATLTLVAGQNGIKITDPGTIKTQSEQLAKSLLSAKGFQITVPTETQAYQSVGTTAFAKLIEVDTVKKQLYAYENGQLVKQYPVSAGAPATPTPVGQYKIFQKLAVQDMRGYNVNGTSYFQPHVHWINYFLRGGYAVHGVYWHGSDWFGNINSSHGCVGLMEDQAKWIYDWAPIGTTVIVHH